jgi:diacylglycerol kinase (ATP)
VFANGHRYGGPFTITSKADLRHSGLQAVVVNSSGKLAQMRQLTRLGLGILDGDSGVEVVPCQRATVRSTSALPALVQCDGDFFGEAPITIEAGGPVFHMIVPEAYARGACATDTDAKNLTHSYISA